MSGGTTRQRDRHGREGTLLCLGKSPNPFSDALEAAAITRGQITERAIEYGPLEEQGTACCDLTETFGILTERCFAPQPHGLHNGCRDRERFRRQRRRATSCELGDRATRQQARAHDLPAIGRRVSARWRRASSARTSANVPPPRANATSAM